MESQELGFGHPLFIYRQAHRIFYSFRANILTRILIIVLSFRKLEICFSFALRE